MMTRAELEAVWDGRLVLMTKRAALTDWRHGGRLCRRPILRNRPGSVGSVADITASAPLRMILHPRRVRPAAGCPLHSESG
jgi:hypothetical protein